MKTLKGVPTWQQEKVIREIIQAGGNVRVVRVKDTGDAIISFDVENQIKTWALSPEGEVKLRTV